MPIANLLVVDDEPANLTSMRAVLEPLGQRVVTAQSAAEALRYVLAEDFAVILLDVCMPEIDGYETARLIKARERSAHIPIIFLTAIKRDDDHRSRGYELGAVDYLFKPIDPDILRHKVAVFVEMHLRGESIRRQREMVRIHRLTNLMPLCLWVARPDGSLEACNDVWKQFSGLPLEASGSLGELATVHPDDRERARGAWRRGAQRAAGFEVELRLRRRDGEHRWHLLRSVPELGDGGRLDGWIATAIDIHDKKQAEDARVELLRRAEEARAEAEAANRAKDDFLATLSHELRTPLNAILGWTHILRHEQPDAGTTARALETLERSAAVQRQLIEDILDVSRIIAGKLTLETGVVDLAAVVRAAVDAVQPSADLKGVTLARVIVEVLRVTGDAARLEQVVLNLLTNAIKFTPAGGRVSVELAERDGQAELAIADDGEGIPRDFLPFVFERFRQADISTARTHGGLGLGLAIARHIVELHGGSIGVDSEGPGRGSRFAARLPCDSLCESAAGSAPPAAPQAASLAGLSVLIVDDSEDVRVLVGTMLERHGARCRFAASAEEALAELERDPPDVLLSDVGLPHEDGFSLIRRVRQRACEIPAAALTAFASAEDGRRLLEAGFQAHLKKPISQPALVAAVAKLARR